MKVLVTGAKGMLGQDLCPELKRQGYDVIPTDYDTLDITNKESINKAFANYSPDIVIHCAAYTNVDKAEEDYENARKLNVLGTENIAIASAEANATLVYISTDYVFDGTKKTPYLPSDSTNPLNIYGKTKLEGEKMVQKYCKKYYIARTSWLYGIHGKNFVETMISLAKNPELKVVDDQIGCPTWTMELINGIVKIINKPYGIYHICGSGSTSWYNFAHEIFKKEGLSANLKPCTTDEFPRKAKRPSYSIMQNTDETGSLTRNWQDALTDYLKSRKVVV
ncbi:MAG: dTDP-4-dehydrorhamnose reductase [Candidatus Gastranaerophilales bacterium]|nr:dTDP-4-dehydrorhamnose reductase [Candidatus Gastranaerophilales bacterium]